jgi:hypothetical protein
MSITLDTYSHVLPNCSTVRPLVPNPALLHKGPASIQGLSFRFTFYLQISTFQKWSRGDSNP